MRLLLCVAVLCALVLAGSAQAVRDAGQATAGSGKLVFERHDSIYSVAPDGTGLQRIARAQNPDFAGLGSVTLFRIRRRRLMGSRSP